jgi:hypothetical protein
VTCGVGEGSMACAHGASAVQSALPTRLHMACPLRWVRRMSDAVLCVGCDVHPVLWSVCWTRQPSRARPPPPPSRVVVSLGWFCSCDREHRPGCDRSTDIEYIFFMCMYASSRRLLKLPYGRTIWSDITGGHGRNRFVIGGGRIRVGSGSKQVSDEVRRLYGRSDFTVKSARGGYFYV